MPDEKRPNSQDDGSLEKQETINVGSLFIEDEQSKTPETPYKLKASAQSFEGLILVAIVTLIVIMAAVFLYKSTIESYGIIKLLHG